MTRRIELFSQYDSKNRTLFFHKTNMTQRIEPLFEKYDSLWEFNTFEPFHVTQRIGLFSYDSKNWTFLEYDAKNWTFLEYGARNCNFFDWNNWTAFQFDSKTQKNWTASDLWLRRSDLFFWTVTLKNWFFLFTTPKNRTFFLIYDSKALNLFSDLCLERIEPFFPIWLKELFF